MPKKKLFWRVVSLGFLIILVIILIPLAGVAVECRPWANVTPVVPAASAERQKTTADLSGYSRPEDQTYLTLPEWYIVYSADEYAAFIKNKRPSQFPYFGAVGQFWRSYYDVCAVTREVYPFNSGYHLSLVVIGTSFTLENIVKGLYEMTLGRAAEWLSPDALTPEEAYGRQVAQEYGDFIHTIPWYEFPFGEKLTGLWTETSLWGPNMVRKWERKFALSLEYGGKALYSWLIKGGTQAAYAPEDLEIQGWARGISEELLAQEPQIRLVKPINRQEAIIAVPRYEAFTQLVPQLTRQGVQFVEIAGNDDMLITAIAPADWTYNLEAGEFLFALSILSQPQLKRVAIKAPVASLHLILKEMENQGIELEHLYDY